MGSESVEREMLAELIKIRELLERNAQNQLREDLESVATTKERKRVWVLCDGVKSTSEIAEQIGISQRTVQIFINELQDKDLIVIEKRGYPKRKYDYIPSEWGI